MCNCNKAKAAAQPRRVSGTSGSARQQFSLLMAGQTVKTGSRLEVDAENARQGYRGIVKPVGSS